MLTVTELKNVLAAEGLRLTKRLGQHHLIDARVIARLIEACELTATDTVVEIGPGLGALTESLARRAGRLIAVEIDRRIAGLLRQRLAEAANLEVICQDILAFNWDRLRGAVVVGAIPYQITSPLLVSLSEQRRHLARAILVLQAEVADRLLARPGTRACGRLTILGQYAWSMSSLMAIPRSAFFPQPDVASRAIRLQPHPTPPVRVEDEAFFFACVKAAFAHRRKTLVNSALEEQLGGLSRGLLEDLVRSLGLSLAVRGEDLSVESLAAFSNACWRANHAKK